MHLAAIGDVHGNLPALEAVLGAIDESGIETLVHTGDAVVGYPWPNEVVDLLRERNAISVQGEFDRMAVNFLKKRNSLGRKWPSATFQALQWTYEALRSDNIEFLGGLPHARHFRREGVDIAVCHGALNSQREQLDPNDALVKFRRQREQAHASLIICGRNHQAFHQWTEDTLFVNPGSAGMALGDSSLARYAVIDTETTPWQAHLHTIPYNSTAAESRLAELGLAKPLL